MNIDTREELEYLISEQTTFWSKIIIEVVDFLGTHGFEIRYKY